MTENVSKPTKLIRYAKYKEIQQELMLCYEETRITGEPHCAAIEAPTGGGKTTLMKDTLLRLNIKPDKYLIIDTPDNPTPKSVISAGLERIGDVGFNKIRYLWEGKARLKRFVIEKGILLIIWDDFQHFLSGRYMSIEEASEYLKTFIKDTGATCFVTGLEGDIEAILDSNNQLSRLFEIRESIGVFSWQWGLSSIEDIQACQQFFAALEKSLALEFMDVTQIPKGSATVQQSNMHRQELIYRIIYAMQGVTANIVNLVRRAAREASMEDEPKIGLRHLSKAFSVRIEKHVKDRYNPFNLPIDTHFTLGLKPINQTDDDNRNLGDILSTT
ncbi:MAG: AAA family ATPase [Chloroflexota bacterium]